MVKTVQMYAEKVVARYDPHSNPTGGGGHQPNSTLKSWQVWVGLDLMRILRRIVFFLSIILRRFDAIMYVHGHCYFAGLKIWRRLHSHRLQIYCDLEAGDIESLKS